MAKKFVDEFDVKIEESSFKEINAISAAAKYAFAKINKNSNISLDIL